MQGGCYNSPKVKEAFNKVDTNESCPPSDENICILEHQLILEKRRIVKHINRQIFLLRLDGTGWGF